MYMEGEIPTVTTTNGGFGNTQDSWWIIILLLLFGYGGRGFGGYGGTGGGVQDGYILASDFSNIERKIDGVNNGLCDGFYAMNTSLLNGFSGVNTNLMNGFANTNSAIAQAQFATQNGFNTIGSQLASCCCDLKGGIKDVAYNIATTSCATQNTIQGATRDIIENQNANYRAIHDELVASRMEQKDLKIAEQQAIINGLQLSASQSAQNSYLISQLRPSPVPAFEVRPPYCYCNNGSYNSVM